MNAMNVPLSEFYANQQFEIRRSQSNNVLPIHKQYMPKTVIYRLDEDQHVSALDAHNEEMALMMHEQELDRFSEDYLSQI